MKIEELGLLQQLDIHDWNHRLSPCTIRGKVLMLLGSGNRGGDMSMRSKARTKADDSIFILFGPTSIDGTVNIMPFYPYAIFSTDAVA